MKEFIKGLKLKRMSASELAGEIAYNQDDLISFFVKDAHRAKNADIINELYSKMKNPKFVKALNKILKAGKKEEDKGLSIGFAVIIAGFIEKFNAETEDDKEVLAEYCEIAIKLLKKRVKEVNKKLDLDPEIVRELLLITPDVTYISNDKFVGIYSQKMLRKLYSISAKKETGLTETKQIKKLFKKLFKEELLDLIAINILLEKKDFMKNFNEQQTALWNLMTNFALELIEGESKKHIRELIEYYCTRRRADANKNRDAARRINLLYVDAEQYPKIAKAVAKFKDEGKANMVSYL